jgi:hypothetical protein
MPLPIVSMDTLSSCLNSIKSVDGQNSVELYAEMFKQQPVFKLLAERVLFDQNIGWSYETKDGYCRGMLQAWQLLNTQSEINEFKETFE